MTASSFERARELQSRAAAVGFDWPLAEDMLEKLAEELAELRTALSEAPKGSGVAEELGDILFVLVNLARRLQLEPETVLESACDKFERRFGYIRSVLSQRGLQPEQVDVDVLEALWQQAKARERGQS